MTFGTPETEPYPQEYRDFGFELWAFVYDRNAAKVADRLNNPLPEDPTYAVKDERQISPRTIRKWADTKHWLEKAEALFKEIAPGIHNQAFATILASSTEAAAYLRHVINDESIDAKFRIDAAKTMLDRSGHMPFIRPSDDSKPVGPSRDYSGAIAGKSTDELLADILGLPSGVKIEATED